MTNREEQVLVEAIRAARTVQTYLWGESNGSWGIEEWRRMFRKRVAKLDEVSSDNPHASVEMKKRLLQTASLSIALMAIIDEHGIDWRGADIPSNLLKYADPIADIVGSETMDPETVENLMQVAKTDWEADLLENLVIRTGFWWKCDVPGGCGYINMANRTRCEGCGASREEDET